MKTFLLRNGPPKDQKVSPLQTSIYRNKERIPRGAGNHSRLTSSDTVLPNGCSESESKNGNSIYWTVRKGGPDAQRQVIANETKQRANKTPGPVGRVIPCRVLASEFRGTTVHTTRN